MFIHFFYPRVNSELVGQGDNKWIASMQPLDILLF
jgi:hypothetical protein